MTCVPTQRCQTLAIIRRDSNFPDRIPLTAYNQSQDMYPDGEVRFHVLDRRDVPTAFG